MQSAALPLIKTIQKEDDSLTLYMLSNIFVCVCAFAGFICGMIRFFKPHKAIYAQMITLAIACIGFGRLYQTIRRHSATERAATNGTKLSAARAT
jgi:hypothetical protein